MDASSENESSGKNTWLVITGILVLVGAVGAYTSGIFGPEQKEAAPTSDVAVQPTEGGAESETASSAEVSPSESASQVPTDDQSQGSETEPQAETSDATETADATEAADATETAEVDVEATPPALDQIFVEPDGNAVLSGNAEPGAEVRVLLDGEQVHSFTVDASGQFAEFVTIPFSNAARGLALEADGANAAVRSDDYLIAALPEPQVETQPAETSESESLQSDLAQSESSQADNSTSTEVTDANTQPNQGQAEQTAEAETAGTDENAQGQQVAILRSGDDGVELVQGATQGAAGDQVALDTIGYSDEGHVELTGRVPGGSVVRVYLNNRLVADLPPADDGKWRSELQGVDPGVYTLRLDEVGTDGTVVSRLETPFKREPLDVLRAAETPEQTEAQTEVPTIRSVTVQEGDTLWAISRERYGDGVLYVRLFDANRDAIRDPDLIYPGQVFTIPE